MPAINHGEKGGLIQRVDAYGGWVLHSLAPRVLEKNSNLRPLMSLFDNLSRQITTKPTKTLFSM